VGEGKDLEGTVSRCGIMHEVEAGAARRGAVSRDAMTRHGHRGQPRLPSGLRIGLARAHTVENWAGERMVGPHVVK
jgi:hypothetical protein